MRELFLTPAARVPAGAELVGGNHDGIVILDAAVLIDPPQPALVTLTLSCGCEATVPASLEVSWLEPEDITRPKKFGCTPE